MQALLALEVPVYRNAPRRPLGVVPRRDRAEAETSHGAWVLEVCELFPGATIMERSPSPSEGPFD
jgi:hypothetical protein